MKTPSLPPAAAPALVAAALLSVVGVATQPDLSGSAAHRLAVMGDGPLPAVSAAVFVLSQLPMLLAALAIGALVRPGAPRLGAVGATLTFLGAFGHAVVGGVTLAEVMMGHDPAHRSAYAQLLGRIESSPIMLFSLLGLAGTAVGLLVLAVGTWRAEVGPRWLGGVLGAFVVVEFAGSAVSTSASYLSGLLLLIAFVTLAREATRTAADDLGISPDAAGYLRRPV